MQLDPKEHFDLKIIILFVVLLSSLFGFYMARFEWLLLPHKTERTVYKTDQLQSYFNFKRLNINTASREELMILPGIGDNYAEAIISYRSHYGKFSSLDEIKNIPGIGNKTFGTLKTLITI